jgi:CheY-like chemotaxis protein
MRKILVVDDSPTSRAIVAKLLGADHRVVAAASGEEALKLLGSEGFDVLLLDLLMPVMDGRGVLKAMTERGIRVPVVVMTADIQDKTRIDLVALGASVIVNKPLNREKLVGAIADALESSGGHSL